MVRRRDTFFDLMGFPLEGLFQSCFTYSDNAPNETACQKYNTDGVLHSEIGPARIKTVDGKKVEEYFIDGEKLTKEEWEKRVQAIENSRTHLVYLDGKSHSVSGDKYRAIKALLQ